MATVTGSRKEEIWLFCKTKTCCQQAIVVPTGRDVWRIARALQAPPWTFLRYFQSPTPRPDGFILDRSGRQFRLALARQAGTRAGKLPPCIFLMRTRDGSRRCGLGALRPQVCHTFPLEVANGVVCVSPNHGCTCRRWSLADVDLPTEDALLETRLADAAEYHEVVAHWNARISDAGDEGAADFVTYCTYLLDVYDQIAGHDGAGRAE